MAVIVAALLVAARPALAEDPKRAWSEWPTADRPAYPSSPYHGVTDGDGRIIPCRCRFDGRDFRLGEQVCMSTHLGTVLARCDLMLNNTSWIPTETVCTISRAPTTPGRLFAGSR